MALDIEVRQRIHSELWQFRIVYRGGGVAVREVTRSPKGYDTRGLASDAGRDKLTKMREAWLRSRPSETWVRVDG